MTGVDRRAGYLAARTGFVALVTVVSMAVAPLAAHGAGLVNLDGKWSVTLEDFACTGQSQGPYPMVVDGFTQSSGDFEWSFLNGTTAGTGNEAGSKVTFDNFGASQSEPVNLVADLSVDAGKVTMTSDVGKCPDGGENAWTFALTSGLIVNSTKTTIDTDEAKKGDCNVTPLEARATCTLSQAILVSNDQGGDSISFNIKKGSGNVFNGEVPQIKVTGALIPDINATTQIDATTQPTVGKVEISGTVSSDSLRVGLTVTQGGGGTTIEGLVINGFQEMIALGGSGSTIEKNWLGTNVAGNDADPEPIEHYAEGSSLPMAQIGIRVTSTHNQIGGLDEGNVIASSFVLLTPSGYVTNLGLEGAADIFDTQGGNVIQGNHLGVSASGAPLLADPPHGLKGLGVQGSLHLTSGADTVGGPTPGLGNVLAGGAQLSGAGTVVQGNTITDGRLEDVDTAETSGDVGPFDVSGAITVGGPTQTPGQDDGNVFHTEASDDRQAQLDTQGSGAVVQGNVFRGDRAGAIVVGGTDVTIGGTSQFGVANLFEDNGSSATEEVVNGLPIPRLQPAAIIVASTLGGTVRIEYNDFESNKGGGAVEVNTGNGVTVTKNVMRGNTQGVTFGDGDGYLTDGSVTPDSTKPNDYQPYPRIFTAGGTGATTITGRLPEPSEFTGDTFTIDLYAMASCAGAPQGLAWVGSQQLAGSASASDFSLSFPALPAGDTAVTATATGSDGSTSEFSPCLGLGQSAPAFTGVGVVPGATKVLVSPTGVVAHEFTRAIGSRGGASLLEFERTTRTGSGAMPLVCPQVTTGGCTGTLTISVKGKTEATAPFSLAPGETGEIHFKLSPSKFGQLRLAKGLSSSASITATDGATPPDSKTTVTTVKLVYKA